jgi:hypothetical protein
LLGQCGRKKWNHPEIQSWTLAGNLRRSLQRLSFWARHGTNKKKGGYITEKIVNAYLSGTVPIWYGTSEIFDVINESAFIFYDIGNPPTSSGKDHLLGEEPDRL